MGLLLLGAPPSVFNGGKSQVNFNFVQVGGEYPFVNVMKGAQSWANVTGSTPIDPSVVLLDSDGYPTVTGTPGVGGIYAVCFCPTQTERPGNYRITWDGSGTIYSGSGSVFSGSLSTSGVVITPPASGRLAIGISSVGTPRITNLKVCHVDDDPNQTFQTNFKDKIRRAGFGVLRFLNWQQGNFSNVLTWAHRRPVTYVTYDGSEYRTELYAGQTTKGTGDDYTVDAPSSWPGLVQGAMATMRFDTSAAANTTRTVTITIASPAVVTDTGHPLSIGEPIGLNNIGGALPKPFFPGGVYYIASTGFTSNSYQLSLTPGGASINTTGSTQAGTHGCGRIPTLDIGGTGAIAVKNASGDTPGTGSNQFIIGGRYGTVTYNEKLGCYLLFGGTNSVGSHGINNAVPPEIMMQLCIELGAHPYFVTPPLTINPATDYMPSLMMHCKSVQPAWMCPRFEGPNEPWNPNFVQTNLMKNIGFLNWGTLATPPATGKNACTLGQIASVVYGGGKGTKYQVLAGVQTQTGASSASASQEIATSATYASLGPVQDPLVGPWGTITFAQDNAYNWMTHICCAQYMTPSNYNDGSLATLASAYAGCSFNATFVSGSTTMTVTSVNTGTLSVDATVKGPNIDTTIASLGTGSGGTGTYILSSPAAYSTGSSPTALVSIPTTSDPDAPIDYAASLYSGSGGGNLASLANHYTAWANLATTYGLKLCGYEGGFSGDMTAGGTSQGDILKAAAKNVPGVQNALTANWESFAAVGGEFPSHFNLGGWIPSSSVWCLEEPIYSEAIPPQLAAIIAWNYGP